ncbi:MAG: transporter substrate-binding domain-containing protein [Deltaproteobacteria bacterium]|nr:transporter substrate-binding domain-containing protein [Deltaproteobacteria bacterium]
MRKRFQVIWLLVFLVIAPCQMAQAEDLVVGCDTNFKPFEFQGPDGKYIGFDMDVWKAVAEDLGVRYTLKPMVFHQLIPALTKGEIDVALAGMTITSEREKSIDFSYPYFDSSLIIMVRAERMDIYGIGALIDKVIATKEGTTSADFALNIQHKDVKLFPNIDQAYKELLNGSADAVIYDAPTILYFIKNEGKEMFKSVGSTYKRQSYGIAFPQGSPLREKVSIAILSLIEDGRYEVISRKWFGAVP